MGAPETKLRNKLFREQGENVRLWRTNAGQAWGGNVGKCTQADLGKMVLKNIRKIALMPKGFPDCAGFKTIEITPEMVGQKVAVFYGVEIKATGKLNPAQVKFKALFDRMGAIFETLTNG